MYMYVYNAKQHAQTQGFHLFIKTFNLGTCTCTVSHKIYHDENTKVGPLIISIKAWSSNQMGVGGTQENKPKTNQNRFISIFRMQQDASFKIGCTCKTTQDVQTLNCKNISILKNLDGNTPLKCIFWKRDKYNLNLTSSQHQFPH